MAHEPQWLRQTGRILASLLQADEDDMVDFVRERLDGAGVPPERAADARALLVHIGEALRDPTPERMMSLEHARRVLQDWKAGVDEQAPEEATPRGVPASAAPASAPAPAAPAPALPVIYVPSGPPAASPWASRPDAPSVDPMAMTTAGTAPPASPTVLPFKGGAAAPKKLSLEPHAAMGQTAPIGDKRHKPVLPFGGKAPTLTLEQYAYFCVERALWPDHQAQTCAKYGIDAAGEQELHEGYRKVLAEDGALRARFNELRDTARAQLSG